MPKRTVEKGADFIAGDHEGVSADINGRLFPVDRNLLSNPAWLDKSADNSLEGWDPPTYPLPLKGLSIYGRPPNSQTNYRVQENSFRRSRLIQENLTTIVTPPAQSSLVTPPAPKLSVYPNASAPAFGWDNGYYAFAYALIRGGRLSAISPRGFPGNKTVNSWTFLHFEVTLTAMLSTAGEGVAIFTTAPQSSQELAQTAPLHLYDIVPTAGRTFIAERLSGPFRAGALAPTENETAGGEIGPVIWSYKPVSGVQMPAMALDVSWSYQTRSGRSSSQEIAMIDVPASSGQGLAVKPPYKPRDATMWRAEWRRRGLLGQWLAYGDTIDFDSPQIIYSDQQVGGVVLIDRALVDMSSLPNPDAVPDGWWESRSSLSGGTWRFTVSGHYPLPVSGLSLEQSPVVESAPSPEASVSAATAGAIRVDTRPPQGNRIFNPLGEDREKATGVPRGRPVGYTFAGNVTGDVADGLITVADTSNATGVDDGVALDRASVVDRPHVFRVSLDFENHSSGTCTLLVSQYDASGTLLVEDAVYTTDIGEALPESEIVFAASGGDFVKNAATRSFQVILRHDGTVAPRSFTANLRVELYEGYAAPISGTAGGYVEILENPAHRPAELEGIELNAMEYFGAYDEPLAEGAHPKNLKEPVVPNQWYALSMWVEPAGVPDRASVFSSGFFGAQGQLIDANAPLVSFRDEPQFFNEMPTKVDEYDRRVLVMQAPPEAAFWQVTGSKLGRGRVRMIGMQFEKGTSETAYDPGVNPDDVTGEWGYTEFIIFCGHTGADGASGPPAKLRNLSEVSGTPKLVVVGEGILGIELSSAPTKNGPWSTPVSDVTDLVIDYDHPWVKGRVRVGVEA